MWGCLSAAQMHLNNHGTITGIQADRLENHIKLERQSYSLIYFGIVVTLHFFWLFFVYPYLFTLDFKNFIVLHKKTVGVEEEFRSFTTLQRGSRVNKLGLGWVFSLSILWLRHLTSPISLTRWVLMMFWPVSVTYCRTFLSWAMH